VVAGFVPVIDVSAAHSPSGRAQVSAAIGSACESSGFFTVVGHGVDQALIDSMYATSRAFFEQPAEEKAKVAVMPGTHGFYANAGSASKSIGQDAPADLNEVFIASVRGDDGTAQRSQHADQSAPWAAVNRWPELPPEFRTVWQRYIAAMEALSRDLIGLFALALGLDEDFFADKIDNDMSTLAANYYYPLTEPPLPGQLRKGPHTDWGNLTILYQDEVGGLQVEQKGHGWRDVPYTPGSFVINIGDLMAFWSAGRWVSTLHRVCNPVEGHTNSRVTVPFFHMPNFDARIEPLFPFSDEGTEQRFKTATTPGEWYWERLRDIIS